MNGTPASSQSLEIESGSTPSWLSDPAVTGAFLGGASVRLVMPCANGITPSMTVTLASTDLAGGDLQPLGESIQGLVICFGADVRSINIPVTTPATLIDRRLQLMITAPDQTLILPFGEHTFLEVTNFVGTP
jgi:hypothetical protein